MGLGPGAGAGTPSAAPGTWSASSAAPAPLPPSVEQAYKQKCIDLKRRMKEVEETNDGYRVRRVRLNRGILKLRLERAFLLEQLARRTAERVDDSEGSPSPPPTVWLLLFFLPLCCYSHCFPARSNTCMHKTFSKCKSQTLRSNVSPFPPCQALAASVRRSCVLFTIKRVTGCS
jgi:hypothetical protein